MALGTLKKWFVLDKTEKTLDDGKEQEMEEKVTKEEKKDKKEDMRKIELKRIAEFFLGPKSQEENKPFSTTSFANHGTISKEGMGCIDDRTNLAQRIEGQDSDDSMSKPQMTRLRKVCFLLSLQGGVVYILFFAWWLPCREPFCDILKRDWRMNLSDAALTTNIETSDSSSLSSLILGYSTEDGQKLASYHISNGSLQWNVTSDFVLRHVFCNFDKLHDAKVHLKSVGIATSYEQILAFNVSNGSILWQTTLYPSKETVHKVVLVGDSDSEVRILGASDVYLYLLNPKNGSQEWAAPLPCSFTVDIKLVGSWSTWNDTIWALVCEYGDRIEVWTTSEEEMLSPPRLSERNIRNDLSFNLLFSRQSMTGSIDLSSDVTKTQDSFAVSWANMVVMATTRGQPRTLKYSWEKQFGDSLGMPLAVRSVGFGSFIEHKSGEIELAVAVSNGSTTSIAILSSIDGRTKMSAHVTNTIVLQIDRIVGRPEHKEMDAIVVESVHHYDTANATGRSDPCPRLYFMVQHDGEPTEEKFIFKDITTLSGVTESNLSPIDKGVSQLVIGGSAEGSTYVTRYVIASQEAQTLCHLKNDIKNFTNVWLLD